MWYYKNSYLEAGLQGSIAGFYNPVICWAGLFCILLLLWRQVSARGTAKGAGVLILYASQLLSWMLVSRCTFMYHYFPSSVFALTAIVLVLTQMKRQDRAKRLARGCALRRWCALPGSIPFCPACPCRPCGRRAPRFFRVTGSIKAVTGSLFGFLKKGLAKNFNYFHELHYIK